jgi:hypothetical protein
MKVETGAREASQLLGSREDLNYGACLRTCPKTASRVQRYLSEYELRRSIMISNRGTVLSRAQKKRRKRRFFIL